MTNIFENNYEKTLWAIATGEIKGEPHNSFDALQVVRGIAQEALGDKWLSYQAEAASVEFQCQSKILADQ